MAVPWSEVELDIAGRRADAGLDARAWVDEVAGPQVAHATRDEHRVAAVADAHAAAVRCADARAFCDAKQRRAAITVRLGATREKAHAPAAIIRRYRGERGGEALDVERTGAAGGVEARRDRSEHAR